MDKKFGVGEWP